MCYVSPMRPSGVSPSPLRVGVLVDLAWTPQAGGHVKCWERLAEAATAIPAELDLTVHFSGTPACRHELAANVRYRVHPPLFSTQRLPFLSHVPDHTDLMPWHPGLARALPGYDVIHTTDGFFAFARTALKVARRRGIPLVNSIHTDTPGYTRVFTGQTVQRLVGQGWLGRLLVERWRLPDRAAEDMRGKLARHQAACAFALVSRPEERERALAALPAERIGQLRRGIDKQAFSPAKRDRAALAARWGIPEDRPLVLFAGRVNRGKNVMTLAHALRRLADCGLELHLFCAGKGDDRDAVRELLGERATCPGPVAQDELQALYAGADLFAFPSEYEVHANVVLEALSSGVAVAITDKIGMAHLVEDAVGVVIADSAAPEAWAAALAPLLADRPRLAAMGRAARAKAERELPSWLDVLRQDLLPRWKAAACSATVS